VKASGVYTEDERFKERWRQAKYQYEKILIEAFKEHLLWAQTETKEKN